jgi:hypothetical protein
MSDKLREELRFEIRKTGPQCFLIENGHAQKVCNKYEVKLWSALLREREENKSLWKKKADYIQRLKGDLHTANDRIKKLEEGIKKYCEARRVWMSKGNAYVAGEVKAWEAMEAALQPSPKPEEKEHTDE